MATAVSVPTGLPPTMYAWISERQYAPSPAEDCAWALGKKAEVAATETSAAASSETELFIELSFTDSGRAEVLPSDKHLGCVVHRRTRGIAPHTFV
jgi:hypothetical protein